MFKRSTIIIVITFQFISASLARADHKDFSCGFWGPHEAHIDCPNGQNAVCWPDAQILGWCIAKCRCDPGPGKHDDTKPVTKPVTETGGTYNPNAQCSCLGADITERTVTCGYPPNQKMRTARTWTKKDPQTGKPCGTPLAETDVQVCAGQYGICQ